MANHLGMAKIHAILTLHSQGWSKRRIARELGIDRGTVDRTLALARSKPASNPPPGSEAGENSKPATNPPAGLATGISAGLERCGPASKCEPFRGIILAKQAQGLSGQRIYQDLVGEQGFQHSYDSIKRFVRHLGRRNELPFRRMECAAGQEAQVDFGTGAPVIGLDGRRRRTYVFRIVLSHSRKAYSEAVFHQTTEDFLRCLENAFYHFGGVPQTLVLDNLKAAVQQADWFDPEL